MKDSISFWCFVFSLHCLIYKVQTARVRRDFYYTANPTRCQALFSASRPRALIQLRSTRTFIDYHAFIRLSSTFFGSLPGSPSLYSLPRQTLD